MAKYKYSYHEERGRFDAYLEDASGKVVWEVHYPEFVEDSESGELIETSTIFEDGYMKHIEDIDGLQKYLASISIIGEDDEITMSDIEPEEEEKDDLYEFVIPNWAMSALINGDYSGLTDEDEDKLNKFIDDTVKEYGNAYFMLPSEEERDLGFKWRNDIDDLGSDCSLLYIRPTNKMTDGGETSKSRSIQMFGLTEEEYDYRDKMLEKIKNAKGDELKALEEEYQNSEVAKKIRKGLSLKAMDKGGTLEQRMKNVLTKEFELPIQMAIYVPSTQDFSKIISKREFQDRYEQVAKYVSNLFGGYSADPIDGGYVFNRDLIQEDVVKVVFYADRDSVEKSFKKVYFKIKDWCEEWGQDSMGFEVENDLYYVNSWTKDAANMKYPEKSDAKSEFNKLSETDKKEAVSKVKEEFRKIKFAGGGDIKDYDNYDDDEDGNEEDEGEANLNQISDDTGIPVDVLKEYAEHIGKDYVDLRSRDINYYGRYDSEEDFMESLVDEGVISGSTLVGYLYMTSTDCRITAGEEADSYVDNMENSVLIDEADLENNLDELNEIVEKIEELENEIQEKTDEIDELEDKLIKEEDEDEIESINEEINGLKEELEGLENELLSKRKEFDGLDYQDEDEIVDAAKEIVRDKQYDYVYDKLKNDPTDYFVNELGAYTEEELAKASFMNIDYEKLSSDFSSDYEIITGEDGDIYVFTSYKKGGAIGNVSVLRKAQKFVNEVNRLISLAVDEDGDPLYVIDTNTTWQSPHIYSPFKLSRGTLYGIVIDYPFGLGSKPKKERIIVRKSDLEFDGIGMLKDVAVMYRRALREAGIPYKLDSDTKFSDGGMTLEEQNKQMLLGKTKEYQHHSRELQEIIAKNPMIPAWVIAKATRASTDISDITHYLDSLPVNLKTGGKLWIQGAIKREGALRKKAKEMGLIKGDEKLSMSDLNRLEALGGVWSKRANLAKTLRSFAQEKQKKKYESGAEVSHYKHFDDGGVISEEEQISGESDKVKEISDAIDNVSADVSEENTELPTNFVGEYKFNIGDTYALNKAIESIKKMSKKFGIKPPEIIIGEPRLVGIDYDEIWGEYKYKVNLTPVTIKVENIFKLPEYDVLGVVDNETGGSVNFSDEKIPNEYLSPSQVCDLCKTNRRRGKTWIVKKISTGEYFRFGSDCVKRVFGINPMTYIRALDYFRKLNNIFIGLDEEEGGRGGEGKRISPKMRVIPFDIALTVVKEVFDEVGYVKKLWEERETGFRRYEKVRINEGQATADKIEDKLLDEKYSHSVVPNIEFLNNFKAFWINLEIGNSSAFEEFLNKIKKQVINEEFRIIDSGMFSFAMHYMAQAKKQAERKPSNFLGVIGEKYDFVNLKVIDKRTFESQFGLNTLWTFVDENENVVKKFGELDILFYVGSESGVDERNNYDDISQFWRNYEIKNGDLFSFTAPIKKHEEYRGVKSTIIGRTSKTKPPKKKKLEYGDELEYASGGKIENQYEGKNPSSIWDYKWNKEQRRHFLSDHAQKIEKRLGRQIEFFYADYKFKDLMPEVQKVIESHIYEGQYAKGGGIDDKFEIVISEERFGEFYDSQRLPYSEGIKYLDKYRNNKNYKQSCEDGEFFSSIDGHHYVKFKKVKKDKSKYGHGGEVNFNWDKVSSVFYAQPIDYEIEIDGGRIPFFYLHREAEKLNGFDICNANYDAFYDSLSQGAFLCRIKYTDGQIKNGICFSKWGGSKMEGLVCLIDDIQGIKSALEELRFKARPLVEEGQKEYLKSIGLYDLLKVDGEYAKGGGTKRKDLFETPEKMPKKLARIFDRYYEEKGDDMDYEDTQNMLEEFEAVGYTFDYYLDNHPYGLRPIGVKLNELEGFEEMARGGGLDYKKPLFKIEFSWDKVTEDDFDSRTVYVNAESVADAENVVRAKFGNSYKNLKIIQIERVMARGGQTDKYVAGYVDLSKVEPSFVNDKALDTLPVIDIVKKDVIKNDEKPIRSSHDMVQLVRKYYGDAINTYEKMAVVMLNRNNKPIYIYDHSKGSITGTIADPQLILAAANKTLAKGIILVHNHPSGNLTPSTQDDDITKKISEACKYFDIVLLDHIIITSDGYFSYQDEGRKYARGGVSGLGAEINEGKVENQYLKFKNAADLWDNGWSFAQRLSFIEDHRLEIEKRYSRKVGSEYKMKDYLYLPAFLQQAIRSHFMEGQYAKGGEVEDLDNITDDLLATKIKIFLEKVKPYKSYWLDDKEDILYVYFDTESPIDQYEKAYKEATSSMEFFDADGVEITHPKEGSTEMVIPLKKNVIFKYKDYSKDYLEE